MRGLETQYVDSLLSIDVSEIPNLIDQCTIFSSPNTLNNK